MSKPGGGASALSVRSLWEGCDPVARFLRMYGRAAMRAGSGREVFGRRNDELQHRALHEIRASLKRPLERAVKVL